MTSTPYLFRLGERLARGLESLDAARRSAHRTFLLSQQNPDGGFCGRGFPEDVLEEAPDTRESDLYYTSFAVRSLVALQAFDQVDAQRVAAYLQATRHRKTSVIDLLSWLYCALMVQSHGGGDVLSDAAPDWPQRLAATLEEFRTADGGYAKTREGAVGSTYHSFLVALCYEFLGQTLPGSDRLVQFVSARQRDDGGFVEIAPMQNSGTNPTAAAVALLQMFGGVDPGVRNGVRDFLSEVRSSEGGFQANTRIPFADGLSTFTGYLTCLDLGLADLLDQRRVSQFLSELEFRAGGFRAAQWDHVADVEYTYYGLALCGLLGRSG
jgi:geranylgeranyl transferase type-2 subunit beta